MAINFRFAQDYIVLLNYLHYLYTQKKMVL